LEDAALGTRILRRCAWSKDRRTARLGRLDGLTQRSLGLSVSPDGNTIIYTRQVLSRVDLMLIENFRWAAACRPNGDRLLVWTK